MIRLANDLHNLSDNSNLAEEPINNSNLKDEFPVLQNNIGRNSRT